LLHYSADWVIVAFMERTPIIETHIQKVIRIAKELDISIEESAVTCDAFEMAFSDVATRRAIFEMIEQLDESAAKRGEPRGLIINYAVEVGSDGIHVGRYADEIPAGEVVNRPPGDTAMIFLKIDDNFPTQAFLGPMMVNRPSSGSEPRSVATLIDSFDEFTVGQDRFADPAIDELPSMARRSTSQFSWPERGWQPASANGVVCSDTGDRDSQLPTELPSERTGVPIQLGPIRLKLNERFPFLVPAVSPSRPGTFSGSPAVPASTSPLLAAFSFHSVLPTSGLSPPFHAENLGHSERKMFQRQTAIDAKMCVSHLDL
jgi:hypothetical protein